MTAQFPRRIAVVGASLAGAHAAHSLRRAGYDGEVVVIGEEPDLPYDRPPLSKGVLAGTRPTEAARLRFFNAQDVSLRLGCRATSLDAASRTLVVDGSAEQFEGIVLATGSQPTQLPLDLDEPFYLRTLPDATRLRSQLAPRRRLAIIGAGLIGCEVAATACDLGVEVVLIDPLQPCERSLGGVVANVLRTLHSRNGVDLRLGTTVAHVQRAGTRTQINLGDGSQTLADAVLVAVGARPATSWLADSQLEINDGVLCDAACVAAPGIVAAGDVARWRHPLGPGGYARLEHWNNAVEQARHAVGSLLAGLVGHSTTAYCPTPWFWSEQYGHKIQVAGWIPEGAETRVVDGGLDSSSFFAHYVFEERVVGAVGFDSAKRFGTWLAGPSTPTSAATVHVAPDPVAGT